MRNKLVYSCSIKIYASWFDEPLESIFCLLLVVEAFSLKKVAKMLEEVVVNQWEVRWILQRRRSLVAQLVEHLKCWLCKAQLGFVAEKNWALSVDQCWLQALQFLVHLIDLLSTLLRCNGFTGIQKAVVNQTGSRPPNSDQNLFFFFWYKLGFGKCFGASCPNTALVIAAFSPSNLLQVPNSRRMMMSSFVAPSPVAGRGSALALGCSLSPSDGRPLCSLSSRLSSPLQKFLNHHCTVCLLAVPGPNASLMLWVVFAPIGPILKPSTKIDGICFLSNTISLVCNKCCCYCLVAQLCLTLLTSWTAAYQAPLSLTVSQSLPKFRFIASVMPSRHLILWHPPLLLP